jgi:hypothetical protein
MTYNYDGLDQYDQDYEQAEAPSYGDVPAGTYQAWVERAWVDQSDWKDHPDFKLQCRITSADHKGNCIFPSQSFDPEYIKHLKGCINALELDPPITRPSEIRERLEDMLDRVLQIKVVHTKGKNREGEEVTYVNAYVQRFICMRQVDAGGGQGSDDEIPF